MRRFAQLASALILGAATLLLTPACAPRRPAASAPPAPSQTIDIESLVRRGCYRCLESAFDLARTAGREQQVFEVAALLALRSRELGLPLEPWLTRMDASMPAGDEWALYRDIILSLPADPLSGDREVVMEEARANRQPRAVYGLWREALATGPGSPLFRTYLDLTLSCRLDSAGREVVDEREEAATAALQQFGTDVPILLYRIGLCGGSESRWLKEALQAEPEFVDAELELGRRELQRRPAPNLDVALSRFQVARTAFPESPVLPALIGEIYDSREQWPEALAAYEAALALVPTHRDGLLGKTMSLSRLERYEEAAATASRLLELGNWFIGPAHYWRGWNLYHLERLDEARTHTDQALELMTNASVVVLSGTIDWRLGRLASAEQELQRALSMDEDQCEAALYLGGVRMELPRWPESLAAFEQAERCFDRVTAERRDVVAELSATPADAALNAWQIAAQEEAIAQAAVLRAEAQQNAAAVRKFLGEVR